MPGKVRFFLLKIPGAGSPGGRGAEGPGGCLRRIGELGGGGLNIFFRTEMSTKFISATDPPLFLSQRVRGGEPEGVRKHSLSKKVFLCLNKVLRRKKGF